LDLAAWLHQLRREEQSTIELAEEAIALCTEHEFPFWLAMGATLRGWALAMQGGGEEGIELIRQGLDAWWATGADLGRPWYLALLAESYGKIGHFEEGLILLDKAMDAVEKSGERYYVAEVWRLKGEFLLRQTVPDDQQVEACFRQAISISRHQRAKSLELRAVISLSRLLQQQGKNAEAWQILSEIYGWFSEGFTTADLREAKVLLEELG
jgi:predicted ATPase